MAYPTAAAPTVTVFALSVTSFAATLPSGIVAGDRLIIAADFRAPGTLGAPAGYTLLRSVIGGGSVGGSAYWERICNGTESGTATFTSTTGTSAIFQIIKVSGSHATEAAIAANPGTNGDNTAPNPPAVTAGWGAVDNLFLTFAASSAGVMGSTIAPTNYTTLLKSTGSSGGSQVTIFSAYRQYNAASDDPVTFTAGNVRFWSAMTIVIRPVAAPAGGGQVKVMIGGAWTAKPAKILIGGAWVSKPVKVRKSGAWVTTPY